MVYIPPKLKQIEEFDKVLLHACCAPCSSAILECLLYNGIRPTVFYFNPNIYPLGEYEIRKEESKRQVTSLGLDFIDGDYTHDLWLQSIHGLECEPERGGRCQRCFDVRLEASAVCAKSLGIKWFTTTLASSRWKDIKQIEAAGIRAEKIVGGVRFWTQNWRKGGLYERRNELLREGGYYNQQYCGCEFSLRQMQEKKCNLKQ